MLYIHLQSPTSTYVNLYTLYFKIKRNKEELYSLNAILKITTNRVYDGVICDVKYIIL